MKINFANWILEQFGDLTKPAFHDEHQSLTYIELKSRVQTLSSALREHGLLPGDVAIICMEDCIDWPCVWLACIYSGVVPMPASTVIGSSLLTDITKFVDCKLMFTGDKPLFNDTDNLDIGTTVWDRNKLRSIWEFPRNIDAVMVDSDAVGYMAMSSGSTGRPKVACYRHNIFFDIVKYIPEKLYGMNQDSVMMSIPKMSWGYGLHNSITYTLGLGATAVVMSSPPAPTAIFDHMKKFRPTVVASSPTIISKLVKDVHKHQSLPDSIQYFSSSGEDLPVSLYDKFYSRFGIKLNTAIGTLEAANICYAATCGNPEPQTVGEPLPGCEFKILNQFDQPCQSTEIGEILVKTSMSAFCYLKLPDKTDDTFVNGWIRTGDLGYLNKDNRLVFVGRVDDVFKVNGLIVSPVETESKILQYPGIEQVAVAGVETDKNKEVNAWVIPNSDFNKDNFQIWLKNNLFPHQIPKRIHYVDRINETMTNKQDRRSLVNQVTSTC